MHPISGLKDELYPELSILLEYFSIHQCYVTLVGGAVRDYFLHGKLSHDLDFEIRCKENLTGIEWSERLDSIFNNLPVPVEVEKLPFAIYRFSYAGFELEFSSPRLEHFREGELHHKNFDVVLSSRLSYMESFSRRDFTINAIGLEFSKDNAKLVDPYLGIEDLRVKKLRPLNLFFMRDPVRFLRSIRFKYKLGFEFSDELISALKLMNLSHISAHYIKSEMMKSPHPIQFWESLKNLVDELKIPVPETLQVLFQLSPIEGQVISNLEEFLLACHRHRPLKDNEFKAYVNYFQVSEAKLKTVLKFLDLIMIVDVDELKKLQKMDWTKAHTQPALSLLVELYLGYHKVKTRDLYEILTQRELNLLDRLKLEHLGGQEILNELKEKHTISSSYQNHSRLYAHLVSLTL